MNNAIRIPFLILLSSLMAARVFGIDASGKIALTGTVSSEAEGPMEGVLVTTKAPNSTISVTVVTDAKGLYKFPASRVAPGAYAISVRAAGYDLGSPSTTEIVAEKTTTVDLKLVKTKDPASQLMSAEWLESVPGSADEKKRLFQCSACHQIDQPARSTYDTEGWKTTLNRMLDYWEGPSTLSAPVPPPYPPSKVYPPDPVLIKYLPTINLSGGKTTWPYELKTLPRPKGEATKVLITEYDLPRSGSLPHDAMVDEEGMVWYQDFHRPYLGMLDPRTGKAKEWEMPVLRPGFLPGTQGLQVDKGGTPWIARWSQGCIVARFDRKTEKFQTWNIPSEWDPENRARCGFLAVGEPGRPVWMVDPQNARIFRLNVETGQFEKFEIWPGYVPKSTEYDHYHHGNGGSGQAHKTYDIAEDSKGNAFICDISGGAIVEIDAKTGKSTSYPIPTPDSGPRRDYMDPEDRLWFGEYYAGKIGMFDTNTKQFKEWAAPIPWSGLYPVKTDKNGEAWSGGMSSDYVFRLNPKNGEWKLYLLPTWEPEIRGIDVDDFNIKAPVTVWIPELHRGKLAKVEPLD